jgi:uncharacterized membrane protein (Fun14 family)
LWRSKSLRLSLVVMLAGLAFWARDLSRGKTEGGQDAAASSALTEKPASPAAGVNSSALFRLGGGFAGGFLIGWFFRKSLKWTLLAAGVVTAAVAAGNHFGLLGWDWAVIESEVDRSFAWMKGRMGAFKDFLAGYLPSAVAGFLGLFKGARYR